MNIIKYSNEHLIMPSDKEKIKSAHMQCRCDLNLSIKEIDNPERLDFKCKSCGYELTFNLVEPDCNSNSNNFLKRKMAGY